MYKVSVVVPIYNVEKYIVRCAESLFSQTLEDMQFVFVDDASSDNSISLLERTLERFPQRKPHTIIHRFSENQGLPSARAAGLARAEAPYVAFCDSDDYAEPVMYARLYETAVQNDSDMVICGRRSHSLNGRETDRFDNPEPGESLIHAFLFGRLTASIWSRLTRTDICRRVCFPKENNLEDWGQIVQLLTYARQVTFIREALYHYVRRPMSITNDTRREAVERNLRQGIANYNLMHDFVMEHHQFEEKDFIHRKLVVRFLFLPNIRRWSDRNRYMRIFPEINLGVLFNRSIPLRMRMDHLLIMLGAYPVAKRVHLFFKH